MNVNVTVSAIEVANEMIGDEGFAFSVFKELISNKDDEFINRLCETIFDEEDEDIILLFEEIINRFAHLKEKE